MDSRKVLGNMLAVLQNVKLTDVRIALLASPSDSEIEKEIQEIFKEIGANVWSANEKLLPGQDWELETKIALDEADFVIILVTNNLQKSGPHNMFIKVALDKQMERPDGGIKTQCVVLEECSVPRKFSFLHPMDVLDIKSIAQMVKGWKLEFDRRRSVNDWPQVIKSKEFQTRWE